jgi:CP family cyanate transporter-like MFS transporter
LYLCLRRQHVDIWQINEKATMTVPPAAQTTGRIPSAALAVVVAGVTAALHLGKLAPAVPALQSSLNLNLVAAGFLLSMVQMAGMTLGVVVGLTADTVGLRRSVLCGLGIITSASALGTIVGMSDLGGPLSIRLLFWLRGLEGMGFLLVVMPAPGLIRAVTPERVEKAAFGLWGAYMPFGVALGLLFGPAVIARIGWPGWWAILSVVSAAAAAWVAIGVPTDASRSGSDRKVSVNPPWLARLQATMRVRGPWLVALGFAVYSFQWIAVIGFLPSIYATAGWELGWSAVLTALAAAMNIVGNVVGGMLLQHGLAARRLLQVGYAAMGVGSIIAFAQIGGDAGAGALPPVLRYLAICAFSLGGGAIPATLFWLVVRVAPGSSAVSTTVGLVQQASAMGQFAGPPLVAWVAYRTGGWQSTWIVTLFCSLIGIWIATRLDVRSRESRAVVAE